MITLNVKGHEEMCSGYSYSGEASFEGKTLKEVLDEIREYAKDKNARYLGDGFGNPNSKDCDCWSIKIDGVIYYSCWLATTDPSRHGTYNHKMDDLLVEKIYVDGGWYCFYDFKIITNDRGVLL